MPATDVFLSLLVRFISGSMQEYRLSSDSSCRQIITSCDKMLPSLKGKRTDYASGGSLTGMATSFFFMKLSKSDRDSSQCIVPKECM